MKIKNLIYASLSVVLLAANACTEENSPWEQNKRNTGIETLEVNADELSFLPRG